MKRAKLAASVEPRLCKACGDVHVYLLDEKGESFAYFTLNAIDWAPFGEDCARLARGEEPHGQPRRRDEGDYLH